MPQECEFIKKQYALVDTTQCMCVPTVTVIPYYWCMIEAHARIPCPFENRYCKYKEDAEEYDEMIAYGQPDDLDD